MGKKSRAQGTHFIIDAGKDLTGMPGGVFYTGILDSGERHTVWHRLSVEEEEDRHTERTVTVYAADNLILGTAQTVDEVIADDRLTQEEKDEKMRRCAQKVLYRCSDALLFEVKGRYLWLKIEEGKEEGCAGIERINVYFPKHTWLPYLPEIYAQDAKSASFLERYLGVFQSFYEDMTAWIEDVPSRLEPSSDGDRMLGELADWMGIENAGLWNGKQLLYLVKNAARMNRQRGTIGYLKEMVWLYTGVSPFVAEYHQIARYFDGGKRERLLKELYAADKTVFTVIVKEEDCGQVQRLRGLIQVIDLAKPAHMQGRIAVLRPYLFLDQHTYLGINSVLGQYRAMQLDGQCKLSFSVIAEGKEKGGRMT